MNQALIAIVIAIAIWWASTGVVMLAARRYAGNRRGLTIGASAVALAGLAALYLGARSPTIAGAYLGFVGAIALWAWHELTFLTGALTGPRKTACPAGLAGAARFRAAFMTIRDHELAILASAGLVTVLTLGGENWTGLFVFMLLWAMRISAKLNIFFGAPHAVSALIPGHLAYLTSYFRTDRISPMLPVTLIAAAGALALVIAGTLAADEPHRTIGGALIAAFLALAILEHVFLMLPIADSALWTWALPKAEREGPRHYPAPAAEPLTTPLKTNEEPALRRVA